MAVHIVRRALPWVLAAVTACSLSGTDTFSPATPVRTAEGVPARFEPPPEFERLAPADTIAGAACLSPLRDPRDGTALRMVRASATLADYEAPAGRYGAADGELLRIECNTGRPVGLVRR